MTIIRDGLQNLLALATLVLIATVPGRIVSADSFDIAGDIVSDTPGMQSQVYTGTGFAASGLIDTDSDGVADASDNCIDIANPDQRDTNGDLFGNACDPDLDNNGIVNANDLGLFRAAFFGTGPDADFNGDGIVNFVDLIVMRTFFFLPPGPSGPADSPASVFTPVPVYESDYEALFSLDSMKTIRIRISEEEWNGLLNDVDNNLRSEVSRQADFYLGDDIATAEYVPNVGFRIRGNFFSRKRPELGDGPHDPGATLVRAHFKIKFNEKFNDDESAYGPPSMDIPEEPTNSGRTFGGVRSLNLKFNKNDPTYMREVLSYDLFRRAGVHTARQAYTRLFIQIGDEPEHYMGVYLMGEHIDKEWAKRRFVENSYLFKCLYQQFGPADLSIGDRDHNADTGSIGEEITDPAFFGDIWSAYRPAYDLKTKDDEFLLAEDKLNNLIELLTGNPSQEQLEAAIHIPTLLKAQAINVFVGMWDDYWRNGNNYYLFFDETSEKWFFVPYDYDISFFDSIFGIDGLEQASFLNWGDDRLSGNPVLMDRVLSFPDFRDEYAGYVRALYDPDESILNINTITNRLDAMRAVVQPHTSGYDALDEIPYDPSHAEILDFVFDRTAHAIQEIGNGQ